jgi:ABC-type multidrug transport system ATPase subunit
MDWIGLDWQQGQVPVLRVNNMTATAAAQISLVTGLTIEGLSYSYKGLHVFADFSLHSERKIVVLRGPSGCGKTTLLKLLSGNLEPTSFASKPSTAGSCLVLQEDSLFPWLSGTENILHVTKIQPAEFENHPMYRLIAAFVSRKACQMSYGQRRMVELFRAILFRPKYLYLDEPFNFLDGAKAKSVVPFLQGEFMEDTTLVMSNHHHDDPSLLSAASVFEFDGEFPITSLRRTK